MSRPSYTSPSLQALQAIGSETMHGYTHEELSVIGEATRLVMEAAMNWPDKRPEELAMQVERCVGFYSLVTAARLREKAEDARVLQAQGLLITDENMINVLVVNDFVPPIKRA